MDKKVIIYVPDKIKSDLTACIILNSPDFSYNLDYFLYIISKVISIPQYNDRLKNLNKVPIYSKILRYEIGKHYKKYLDYLIDNKLMETDNHYVVSTNEREGKCKCYGLPVKYKKAQLVEYQLTKKSLLKQLVKWRVKTFGEISNDETVMHLYDMMNSFTVDEKNAKIDLDNMLNSGDINKRQYEIEINKCKRINKSDSFGLFITKDAYSRIHTNFTNISKNVRENHLYVDGHKAISIDIVSSQASMLGKMFNDYIRSMELQLNNPLQYTDDGHKMVDIREKYINSNNWIEGKHVYGGDINREFDLFGYESYECVVTNGIKEIKKYDSILEIGGMYEFFQDKIEEYFDIVKSRDLVKKHWISYLFGNGFTDSNKLKHLDLIRQIWVIEFPLLTKILMHFKKYNYKSLSHALQRIEADILFNKICPRIEAKLNLKYCTVHDSILIDQRFCEEASEIFDEILKQEGIKSYAKYSGRFDL